MRRVRVTLLTSLTILVIAACGQTTEQAGASDASDDAPGADAKQASNASSEAPSDAPFSTSTGLCDGGTTAPDGGACDGSRLQVVHRGTGQCFGVGQFCDSLQFSVDAASISSVPAPFTCGSELGVATCSYPVVGHQLDNDAIAAACAATIAFPDVQVTCVIYD